VEREAARRATFAVADGLSAIDTVMTGRYLVTSAYLLDATEPALVETGPATSAVHVEDGLAALGMGPQDLAHVIVTHIHLDHAGGAGTIARRYPNARLWVHERGAPHLADPTKLVASTARTYGEERMRRFFGTVEPVPAQRLTAVEDGDRISLGDRELSVFATPGHASHHMCLEDSRTGSVFAGDALGVHLPDVGVLRPATPPPEFDIDLAVDSIERIRDHAHTVLLL
jgi:glyoxylase-like metal-dependent hydrolase (beta-lactamase superfamily II)